MKSDPNGTRTRVAAVKGRSPRPLDDGAVGYVFHVEKPNRRNKARRRGARRQPRGSYSTYIEWKLEVFFSRLATQLPKFFIFQPVSL